MNSYENEDGSTRQLCVKREEKEYSYVKVAAGALYKCPYLHRMVAE